MSWDAPSPSRISVVLTWTLMGAFSVGIWVLAIVGAWSLAGCATGRVIVHPADEVELSCAAIGEDAQVTFTAYYFESNPLTTPPQKTIVCKGGPLVPSLLQGVGSLITSLLGWLWL